MTAEAQVDAQGCGPARPWLDRTRLTGRPHAPAPEETPGPVACKVWGDGLHTALEECAEVGRPIRSPILPAGLVLHIVTFVFAA